MKDPYESFVKKVCAMRKAQRDYFNTRSKENLIKAKKLELEVDLEIDAFNTKVLELNLCWRNSV